MSDLILPRHGHHISYCVELLFAGILAFHNSRTTNSIVREKEYFFSSRYVTTVRKVLKEIHSEHLI